MNGYVGWAIGLAVLAIILIVLTILSHQRDRAAFRAQQLQMAPGGGAPAPPDSITPFLAAATLIVVGVLAVLPSLSRPYADSVRIGACNATFSMPSRAGGTATVANLETTEPACASALANAVLFVGGRDVTSSRYLSWTNGTETKATYWSVPLTAGANGIVLVVRDQPLYIAQTVSVKPGTTSTSLQTTKITAGSCIVDVSVPSSVSKDDYYAVDVSFASHNCDAIIGDEKVLLDSASDKAVLLKTLKPQNATDIATDRYLVKATGTAQRIDVLVNDTSGGSLVKQYTVHSSTAITLDNLGTIAAGIFGLLSTIGGLVTAVVQIFKVAT